MPATHILSRSFWGGYWLAVRRMRRDRASRVIVLRITGFLIYLAIYLTWIARGILATHDAYTYFGLGFGAALLGGAFLLVAIWNWNDERVTRREIIASVDVRFRDGLRRDAFALSLLIARAASETMLKTKTLPDGVEVVTRQRQLETLRRFQVLDLIPGGTRDLLLLPDGHWTPEQIASVWPSVEALRCLRWILCLDLGLGDLGEVVDKSIAPLLANPERLFQCQRVLDPWDIRVERNIAQTIFNRCYAEQVARGILAPADAEQHTLSLEIQQDAREGYGDYFMGTRTVGELEPDALGRLFLAAYRRWSCLEQTMAVIDGAEWSQLSAAIFPSPH